MAAAYRWYYDLSVDRILGNVLMFENEMFHCRQAT